MTKTTTLCKETMYVFFIHERLALSTFLDTSLFIQETFQREALSQWQMAQQGLRRWRLCDLIWSKNMSFGLQKKSYDSKVDITVEHPCVKKQCIFYRVQQGMYIVLSTWFSRICSQVDCVEWCQKSLLPPHAFPNSRTLAEQKRSPSLIHMRAQPNLGPSIPPMPELL